MTSKRVTKFLAKYYRERMTDFLLEKL